MKELYQQLGISSQVYDFCHEIEESLKERFEQFDKTAEYNQMKVLLAMQKNRVSEECFGSSSGYGYNDYGRDTLEKVYADTFHTEACLVRPQIACGTHALAIALFGNLRPGDEMLAPAGKPYDTLEEVIGIRPSKGSLAEYGVTYRQVDPLFSVDLSDPENPKILGELKIPGFSEYLHPYGDGKLLGIGMDVSEDGFTTEGVKLSMFNVTDLSNVTEENKYTIEDSYGTDVGYNYKGVFVDVQKNLFGFITYHDGVTYQLYTYDEAEGFKEVMSRQLSGYEGSRGLYIGDVFYLVSGNMIESYSMNGFEKMDDIVL